MTKWGGRWTILDEYPLKRLGIWKKPSSGDDFWLPNVTSPAIQSSQFANTNILEIDLYMDFTEYMFEVGVLGLDTGRYSNSAFLADDGNEPDLPAQDSFQVLGEGVNESIRASSVSSTTNVGAVAIGTDQQAHDLFAGGEFGGQTDSSYQKVNTIDREHYIQTTPITSKIRIKLYGGGYVKVYKFWVR